MRTVVLCNNCHLVKDGKYRVRTVPVSKLCLLPRPTKVGGQTLSEKKKKPTKKKVGRCRICGAKHSGVSDKDLLAGCPLGCDWTHGPW